jgi:hypothetical protein
VLWNSGIESDKEIVRKRKRRLSYVTNVLVIQDSKNPENEGKVFMFKFGQKIFEKIVDKIQPPVDEKGKLIDPDDKPMNPFDLEEGGNFKLKIRKVEGYANFDKSEFEAPSVVEDAETVMKQLHDINALTAESSFKDYQTLSTKLSTVLGGTAATNAKSKGTTDDDADEKFIKAAKSAKPAPQKAADDADDSDSDLAYFKKLAADD